MALAIFLWNQYLHVNSGQNHGVVHGTIAINQSVSFVHSNMNFGAENEVEIIQIHC